MPYKNHYKLNNDWTMETGSKDTRERYSHWPCQRLFVWWILWSTPGGFTVNPGHAGTIFLKFERSFEIYMSVLKIANEISEFPAV